MNQSFYPDFLKLVVPLYHHLSWHSALQSMDAFELPPVEYACQDRAQATKICQYQVG